MERPVSAAPGVFGGAKNGNALQSVYGNLELEISSSQSIHVDSEISGCEKATALERLQCYPCPVFNANHLAKNESVLPFCYDAYVTYVGL